MSCEIFERVILSMNTWRNQRINQSPSDFMTPLFRNIKCESWIQLQHSRIFLHWVWVQLCNILCTKWLTWGNNILLKGFMCIYIYYIIYYICQWCVSAPPPVYWESHRYIFIFFSSYYINITLHTAIMRNLCDD